MNIRELIEIEAGGPGSGCHGDSCGRPPGPGHPEDHSKGRDYRQQLSPRYGGAPSNRPRGNEPGAHLFPKDKGGPPSLAKNMAVRESIINVTGKKPNYTDKKPDGRVKMKFIYEDMVPGGGSTGGWSPKEIKDFSTKAKAIVEKAGGLFEDTQSNLGRHFEIRLGYGSTPKLSPRQRGGA